ncbi:hypothetical protein DW927_03075 [Roseburia intestinalis]|uniref:Uncharacterized protein n=1 Tax=Roseburia intestinalis TaxID=166486 RepID=A0A3R6CJ74_9FIRM|nr:hypothetical protein [Roseburia intestinalis]RHA69806.1 hypothetical protein DW927_03075 [Roseburia intestinalis]
MDKKNIVKKFMKDMEQRQNEFSMALSDCIGAVDAADAAIKVVVMEQYCEILKAQEPENFDPALYQILKRISKKGSRKLVIGTEEEVAESIKKTKERYKDKPDDLDEIEKNDIRNDDRYFRMP